MFKLIRNVNILNGTKCSRIADNILAQRSFCDANPRMEKTMNSIQLLGRVGNEPQQKGSEANPVISFSLATHNSYKTDKGEWIQRVDWHKIAVFKPHLRETVMNYLSKGQRVLVNGTVSYGEVKDNEGVTRPVTSIIADEIVYFN